MKIAAQAMSFSREKALHNALLQIREASLSLRGIVPTRERSNDSAKIYQPFKEHLEALPLAGPALSHLPGPVAGLAEEAMTFLESGASIALVSQFDLPIDLALACLADSAAAMGIPMARFIGPAIQVRGFVDLVRLAPGIITIPSRCVSLASNPYEIGSESQAMVDAVSGLGKPVVFTGSFDQHQVVFSGGQAGKRDPLKPVVMRIPNLPADLLSRFAAQSAGRKLGVELSAKEMEEIAAGLTDLTEKRDPGELPRFLPLLANKVVKAFISGKPVGRPSMERFMGRISTCRETFAGYGTTPRASRLPEVQASYRRVAFSEGLGKDLREALVGQEDAIAAFESRFRAETLHRPVHQPLRLWGVGPAGTGKSVSTRILAQHLGVPHIQIDCSGFADFYSALASLTGSGRGIVGSHTPGKLQSIAQLPAGAVVEVSELDHAQSHIRAQLADFYLQGLDTGEAQSAMGSTFSLANIVFYFTMNLPEGMDMKAWKGGVGFAPGALSRAAVAGNIGAEMQRLFSSAFLSRMGDPVLFAPIDPDTAVRILERTLVEATRTAVSNLGMEISSVRIAEGLGGHLLPTIGWRQQARGARAIQEYVRKLVSDEVARRGWFSERPDGNHAVEVRSGGSGGDSTEIELHLVPVRVPAQVDRLKETAEI